MEQARRTFLKDIARIALLGYLPIIGCNEEKPMPKIETNASSIKEEIVSTAGTVYNIDEIRIGDKLYRAIPLQDNQTAEISGKTIRRELLGNVFLFPYDNHSIKIEGNKVTLEPSEENYFLINIKKDADKLIINEGPALANLFVTLNRNNLESKVEEGTKGPAQARSIGGIKSSKDRISFNGIPYQTFPADFIKIEGTAYLPQIFVDEKESKEEAYITIKDGREETKSGLRGYVFIPIKGKLISRPASATSATGIDN